MEMQTVLSWIWAKEYTHEGYTSTLRSLDHIVAREIEGGIFQKQIVSEGKSKTAESSQHPIAGHKQSEGTWHI